MPAVIPIEQQVKILFAGLNRVAAAQALPAPGTLASRLKSMIEKASTDVVRVDPSVCALFGTAAVEMWQRAVHSFLISASLTETSPIWASVGGYYASHYSVRGLAHLLGVFQSHTKKRVVRIDVGSGPPLCRIEKKNAGDREHKLYWKVVKDHGSFAADPFFTFNKEGDDDSDAAHRNVANYWDHIDQFPRFRPLDESVLRNRIEQISGIELSSVPIPDRRKYPDVEAVQLVAYHRITKFRSFLDGILAGGNRFWSVHRNPSWCANLLDFQVVRPTFVDVYSSKS